MIPSRSLTEASLCGIEAVLVRLQPHARVMQQLHKDLPGARVLLETVARLLERESLPFDVGSLCIRAMDAADTDGEGAVLLLQLPIARASAAAADLTDQLLIELIDRDVEARAPSFSFLGAVS